MALGFRPYPQYGAIAESTNNGLSNYNSLQAVVTKRMSHGLDFSFNYVWSHFLDNIDSSGWGSRAGVQAYQNSYNPGANYSNSNFDVRNAFKGSAVYQLPFGKGRMFLNNNRFLDEVVGGWQATGTLVLQGGQPFTVTMKTNNSYAQAGSWYPNLIGNPRLANRGPYHGTNQWFNEAAFAQPANGTFGTFRRNTLYGPGLEQVNFSLGKTFPIHESIGLQIRADANNLFNHPSFRLPTSSLFTQFAPTRPARVALALPSVRFYGHFNHSVDHSWRPYDATRRTTHLLIDSMGWRVTAISIFF